jgi:uncharacterized protein with PIN domain
VEIRFYLDEDSMARSLVRALRARGVDVESALEAGMIDRSDAEHLDLATRQGRVLFSFNVGDFYRLHTEYLDMGKPHGGVVVSKQQHYSVGEVMRRLLRLLSTRSAEEMQNRFEFLAAWG